MKSLRQLFALLGFSLLLGCSNAPNLQLAQWEGNDESGLGGTGYRDDASGLGGTGYQDDASGLGGTGIIGEITGFGSIFVNGIEVEITDRTRVFVDGQPARPEPAIGDIVLIRTRDEQPRSTATELHFIHEVIGQVQKVDAAASRLMVQGQTVMLDTPRQDLPEPGQVVAVSGLRDEQGRIHASRIQPVEHRQKIWLRGTVQRDEKGHARIGQQRIQSAALPTDAHSIGVSGMLKNGVLQVQRKWQIPATLFDRIERLRLQGFVKPQDDETATLAGFDLSLPAQALTAQDKRKSIRLELRKSQTDQDWRNIQTLNPATLPQGKGHKVLTGPASVISGKTKKASPPATPANHLLPRTLPVIKRPQRPLFPPGRGRGKP